MNGDAGAGALRILLDQLTAPTPGGIGRYTRELTRALVATAPAGREVAGWSARISPGARRDMLASIPGLRSLELAPQNRHVLAESWRRGLLVGRLTGHVHATSLLAPLGPHRRAKRVVVATIHDAVPWTHPATLTPRGVAWHRSMAQRAQRFADAIVVPTEAVAHQLEEFLRLGERVRVIGGAPSASVAHSTGSPPLAGLPERYIAAVGTLEPRKGLRELVGALSELPEEIHLVHVGPHGWGEVDIVDLARDQNIDLGRIHPQGHLNDAYLASVVSGAVAFVMPSLAEGFGLPALEAMSLGTPTIVSDAPALVEVTGGAALIVPIAGPGTMSRRLAEAISRVTEDAALADRLRTLGESRARAYSWEHSAHATWQLHHALGLGS